MPLPIAKPSSRKWIWIGLIVIAVGIWEIKESVDSYRTGEPIHTYRHTTMEWWEQLPVAGLTILFGGLVVGVGFGWIKPRGTNL
jgi:putative Mn2+ efflux pump MntP